MSSPIKKALDKNNLGAVFTCLFCGTLGLGGLTGDKTEEDYTIVINEINNLQSPDNVKKDLTLVFDKIIAFAKKINELGLGYACCKLSDPEPIYQTFPQIKDDDYLLFMSILDKTVSKRFEKKKS